ncbi:GNAT family N-acetyltransferase [Thalassotalea sediminis]|uniref:GNAT family N-acetyltransferase n=1 Tax=Thalassotalea sediminis TaxID=1759089 RepID=UPI0025726890|nr:GNAT family N-acetyltransferase [Thalassotalea sediminis]
MDKTVHANKYVISVESPKTEEFLCLRHKVGWGELDYNLAQTSLNNSLFHIIVRDKSQLIGMGRIVGDGAMYFYIQDVIVDPDYQGAGLGSILMDHIERYLSVAAKKGATIGLLAAKGKEAFYLRYGYLLRPNDMLGNGMCKFI